MRWLLPHVRSTSSVWVTTADAHEDRPSVVTSAPSLRCLDTSAAWLTPARGADYRSVGPGVGLASSPGLSEEPTHEPQVAAASGTTARKALQGSGCHAQSIRTSVASGAAGRLGARMAASFVLIHSPSVGPRTWQPVAHRLTELGWEAIVPSLLHVTDQGRRIGPGWWTRSAPAWARPSRARA